MQLRILVPKEMENLVAHLPRSSVVVMLKLGPMGLLGCILIMAIGIQPRSNGAYKNGPDGNAVISSYQDPALCPIGVTIEKTESGQLVKNAMLDGKEWRCLIWKNNFEPKKERSWEWSISGPPATEESRAWATVVFKAIETKFKETAKNEGIQFQPNTSGPADQMFLFARRSVLVTNATPLDEGRGSEYPDPYNILTAIGPDRDFKFNRLPEVLVTDHKEETDVPMSFHDLHLLGKNIALQVFVTPRAYKHRGKLSWDFRLICVKVLGKKEASLAVSPSKAVLKRKAVYIGNIESTAKKQKASGSSLESSST
ncbi:hypothetical protein F5051DRAFT_447119 [Lentinula edodes]|nr:hypothetical protein F5051DRAFT_447119 [Lentinula edodes]